MLFRAIMKTLEYTCLIVMPIALLVVSCWLSVKFIDAFGFVWFIVMFICGLLCISTYNNYQDEKKSAKLKKDIHDLTGR